MINFLLEINISEFLSLRVLWSSSFHCCHWDDPRHFVSWCILLFSLNIFSSLLSLFYSFFCVLACVCIVYLMMSYLLLLNLCVCVFGVDFFFLFMLSSIFGSGVVSEINSCLVKEDVSWMYISYPNKKKNYFFQLIFSR